MRRTSPVCTCHGMATKWYEDVSGHQPAQAPEGTRRPLLDLLQAQACAGPCCGLPKVEPVATLGIEFSVSNGVRVVSPAAIALYEPATPDKIKSLPPEILCAKHPFGQLSLEAQQQALTHVIGDELLHAAADGHALPVCCANGALRSLCQHVASRERSVATYPPQALTLRVVRDEARGCVFLHDVSPSNDSTNPGNGHEYECACTTLEAIHELSPDHASAAYIVCRSKFGNATVFIRSELDGTTAAECARSAPGEPTETVELDGGLELLVWSGDMAARVPRTGELVEIKTCKYPLNSPKAFDVSMQMAFSSVDTLLVGNITTATAAKMAYTDVLRRLEMHGSGVTGVVKAVTALLERVASDPALDGVLLYADAPPPHYRRRY
eukprot:TRINITY_DN4444_c0_g1_i1.p1 TRINITY_DN4444_c0_g1~~TRINITY_DN4444_c0_g1_i1.p1  ORF type:complete len:382 (-),score=64.06 TRINITY_DN4444_c0_g1_i1:427-1572(-)